MTALAESIIPLSASAVNPFAKIRALDDDAPNKPKSVGHVSDVTGVACRDGSKIVGHVSDVTQGKTGDK